MPSLLPEGKQKFFGNDGRPLVGGKIFTFAAGTNTPKPTFTDSAGTTPQTNPVILDSRGEALMFWDGAYKVQLTDALNNILWTVDNVRELVPDYRTSSTGSIVTPVGTTAQRDLNPAIGFFRFNTTTNGFEGFVSGQWKPIVFDSADVTLSSSSTVVGAVKLDNPGGALRSFSQWTGAAYANVLLNSNGGYAAPTYSLNLANCFVASNIGTGNPGFQYDVGDYMDYDRANNKFRAVIGGAEKLSIAPVETRITGTVVRDEAGTVNSFVFNSAAPLDQKYSNVLVANSEILFVFYNDAFTTNSVYDRVTRAGATLATRHLNETSGRLLVGQSTTDNGVTALQTTSYSASNQPSLTGGSGNTSLIAPNASAILDITTRTLKGGVTVGLGSTRITAPVAGLYLLSGSVGFFNGAVKGSGYIRINKNDVFVSFQGEANTVPNQGVGLQINLQIPLLANDFITIQVVNAPDAGGTNASATIRDISFTKIN